MVRHLLPKQQDVVAEGFATAIKREQTHRLGMDALMLRVTLIAITLFISTGATYRTRNFVVTAPTAEEARTVAEAGEEYRRRLAIFWTGKPLNDWSRPCPVKVRSGSYGAAGQTTFQFVGNSVRNWRMMVQGSSERILDSVLPHEVNHTIFASYFRRPLPRWADEGASTLFEHRSEQQLQLDLLGNVVRNRREFIPLRKLLSMKQYPTGHRPMLILYAEGFGLVDFLMQQGGRETYLRFLSDARDGRWEAAIRKHYNHEGVEALERDWRSWVVAGMPRYGTSPEEMIATLGTESRNAARPDSERVRTTSIPTRRSSQPSRTRTTRPGKSDRSSDVEVTSTSRQRQKSGRDRQFSVQAPALPQEERKQPRTATPEPGQPYFSRNQQDDALTTPFSEATKLQPTHQSTTGRRRDGVSLLWKRDVDTGSTPQWAGFPGQKELF